MTDRHFTSVTVVFLAKKMKDSGGFVSLFRIVLTRKKYLDFLHHQMLAQLFFQPEEFEEIRSG